MYEAEESEDEDADEAEMCRDVRLAMRLLPYLPTMTASPKVT